MSHSLKHVGQETGSDMKDCHHSTLVKAEQSGINDVDTDVQLYTCSTCGKFFTITDY
jgi:hypothetical protein